MLKIVEDTCGRYDILPGQGDERAAGRAGPERGER